LSVIAEEVGAESTESFPAPVDDILMSENEAILIGMIYTPTMRLLDSLLEPIATGTIVTFLGLRFPI
jgi:hypothetical protein